MSDLNTTDMSQKDLEDFYEGQVTDSKRLLVEEFLIDSPVGLMEFFTIKREREAPVTYFAKPSTATKEKLLLEVASRGRQFIVQRRKLMATAAAVVLVAGAVMVSDDLKQNEDVVADSSPGISIDATAELVSAGAFM